MHTIQMRIYIVILISRFVIHTLTSEIENGIFTEDLWQSLQKYFLEIQNVNVVLFGKHYESTVIPELTRTLMRNHVPFMVWSEVFLHRISPSSNDWAEGIIILIKQLKTLEELLSDIQLFKTKPNAKYVVVLEGRVCNQSANYTDDILQRFWIAYNILNIVLVVRKCENYAITFQKYFPFEYRSEQPLWGVCHQYNLTEFTTVGPYKIRNMNRYPLRYVMFKAPTSQPISQNGSIIGFHGVDRNTIDALQQAMNFSTVLTIDKSGYGNQLANGSFTGSLRHIIKGDIDVVMVPYFIKDYGSNEIDFSIAILDDSLCIVVNKAERVPTWFLMVYCFQWPVWLAIFTLHLTIWFVWYELRLPRKRGVRMFTVSDSGLDSLRVLVGTPVVFTSFSTYERVFFSFAMLTCLNLTGCFQGSLVTVLTTPTFKPDITSLQELAATRIPITTGHEALIREVFPDHSVDPVSQQLRKMLSLRSVSLEEYIASRPVFAVLARRDDDFLTYDVTKFITEDGFLILHYIRQCPRKYGLAYVFRKHSPYTQPLNTVIQKLLEGGFPQKWRKDLKFNRTNKFKFQIAQIRANYTGFHKFNMEDLKISFLVLTCGVAFAVFCLLLEIITSYKWRKR